jgi:hypothetical protein
MTTEVSCNAGGVEGVDDVSNACGVCLKHLETIKCNECNFDSCEECIIEWFSKAKTYSCPQCRSTKSYDIDYSKITYPLDEAFSKLSIAIQNLIINNSRERFVELVTTIFKDTNNTDNNIIDNLLRIFNEEQEEIVEEEQEEIVEEEQEIIHPNFTDIPLDIVVNEMLKDGQSFFPDIFLENFNNLPQFIQSQWNYEPLILCIDGIDEIVKYTIKKNN